MTAGNADSKLVGIISDLMAYETGPDFDLDEWYDFRGVAANEPLNLLAENGTEVPHQVWHYLSDADIRAKDTEYAKIQIQALREVWAFNA